MSEESAAFVKTVAELAKNSMLAKLAVGSMNTGKRSLR